MRSTFALLTLTIFTQTLAAQTLPRIAVVSPAGGKAGTTIQVTAAGENLDDIDGLLFSFAGAKVEAQGSETLPEEAPKKKGAPKAAPGPKAAVKFKVTLPANVPLGLYDVRVVGKRGVSNPRAFVIGDLPEEMEKEPNDDAPLANKVPLNVTINGVIDKATDVDYFQFAGKKGQHIVISCLTTGIESKLQANIELYSLAGKFLGSNRNYQNNDAVLDVKLPEDGDYLVRLFGFTHTAGGADYNYRLTIATMPWIDSAVPAAVEPGKETKVEVLGRNLPGGVVDPKMLLDGHPLERATVTVKAPGDAKALQQLAAGGIALPAMAPLDGFDFRIASPSGSSNPYFLALAKSPVAVEAEPNNSSDQANPVNIPVQVSGRIDTPGDVDWFRFNAKTGVPLSIELYADRLNPNPLGAAIDLKFVVLDPKGKILATVDEDPEVMAQHLYARSEDPARYRLVPTEDGEYKVAVSSADGSFSPRHVYSLRIAPEDGDFRVVAMPAAVLAPDSAVVGASGNFAYNLFVWRLGNFTGDIHVQGGKLPPGVSVKPQVINAFQKQAAVVVSVAADAPPFASPIELEAYADIDGKKLVRDVRAATITYPVAQAGPPLLSRIHRDLVLAVRDKAVYAIEPSKEAIKIAKGDKIELAAKLKALAPEFKGTVQVSAVALPTGLTMTPATLSLDKDTPLVFDVKAGFSPGNYTLILKGQTKPIDPKQPAKGPTGNIVEHSQPILLSVEGTPVQPPMETPKKKKMK